MEAWKTAIEGELTDISGKLDGGLARLEQMITALAQQVAGSHNSSADNNSNADNNSDADVVNDQVVVPAARSWAKKVELPVFEGVDPMSWIAWAEKIFRRTQCDGGGEAALGLH